MTDPQTEYTIEVIDSEGNQIVESVPPGTTMDELVSRFRRISLWLGYDRDVVDQVLPGE